MAQLLSLHLAWGLAVCAVWGSVAVAAAELPPDFEKVASSYASQLATLSSDLEAQQLFQSLAPALGLHPSETAQSSEALSTRLMRSLAMWRLADSLRDAADLQDPSQLASIKLQLERQAWLLNQPGADDLQRARRLLEVLVSQKPPKESTRDRAFDLPQERSLDVARDRDYASEMDRRYPDLFSGKESWVEVAEKDGASGIQQRLNSLGHNAGAPQDMEATVAHYFETRLRPVLTAQLAARAVQARTAAENRVRQAWSRLHDSAEQLLNRKSLARLCGTWQWTIHNHRNHQEQKLVMSFPSPEVLESPDGAGNRPARAIVLGDAVYLRWEFQGGIQEDSLLFTNKGQRLEGSFTNSAGAWGSITGKKTGSCEAHGRKP